MQTLKIIIHVTKVLLRSPVRGIGVFLPVEGFEIVLSLPLVGRLEIITGKICACITEVVLELTVK